MGSIVSDEIILNIVKSGQSEYLLDWAVDQATRRGAEFRVPFAAAALDLVESDLSKLTWIVPAMNDLRAWPNNPNIVQRLQTLIERIAPRHFDHLIQAIAMSGPSALETVLHYIDGHDLEMADDAAQTLAEFPTGPALLSERLELRPGLGAHIRDLPDLLLGSGWTPKSVTATLASLTKTDPKAPDSDAVEAVLFAFGGLKFECASIGNTDEWVDEAATECSPIISKELAERVARSLNKGKAVGAVQALHGAIPTGWLETPKIPDEPDTALARCILQILETKRDLRERLAKWDANATCGLIAAAIATLSAHEAQKSSSDPSAADLAKTIESLSHPDRLSCENLWVDRAVSFGAEAVQPISRLLDMDAVRIFERAVSVLAKISDDSALRALLAFRSKDAWRLDRISEAVEPAGRTSVIQLDLPSFRAALEADDVEAANVILRRWTVFKFEAAEIVDAVLPHGERFVFSGDDSETFMEFVLTHPDARFLPLVDLWRPGETVLTQMSMVLLSVHQPGDARLAQIINDYGRIKEAIETRARQPFEPSVPLRVPMRCRQCKAVYTYEIKLIRVSAALMARPDKPPADEFVLLDDVLVCKRCGAIDECMFTDAGRRVLELQTRLAAHEERSKSGKFGALELIKITSTVGDDLTFSETLSRLDKKIAAHPEDRGAHLARANTYLNMRRLPQALDAYSHLLKRWPDYSEGFYQRALTFSRLKRHAEALEDFKRAALSLKESNALAASLEDDLRALLREAARAAEKPVPIDALNALDDVFQALPKTEALAPYPRRNPTNMNSAGEKSELNADSDDDFEDDGFDDEDDDADDFDAEYERQRARIPPNEHRRISQELVGKILQFGKRYMPESDWDEAASRWTGHRTHFQTFLGNEIKSEQEHAAFAMFIEYRIHDWRPTPDAMTLAQKYKQDEWPRLTHAEQAQLTHWLEHRRSGLFEIEDCDEARSISTILDYFTGETFSVYDFTLAQKASKGQLFLTAVFPCGQRLEVSGALTEVPRHMRFSLESWLKSEFLKWQTGRSKEIESGWTRFFSERGAEIRRELERIADLPPLVLLSTGEPPTPGHAIFDVRNRLTVRTALEGWKALTYVSRNHGNEIEGELFEYLRRPNEDPLPFARAIPADDQPDGRKVFVMGTRSGATDAEPVGSIVFGISQLEIQAHSKERVEFLRKELESRTAKGLRFVRESVAEKGFVDRAWKEKDSNVAPREEMNPEYADVADEYLANHMRAWVDMRLPALKNRTPRQAAADPGTRRDVENLLRDMEQAVSHSRKVGPKERNEIRRVRSELGLG